MPAQAIESVLVRSHKTLHEFAIDCDGCCIVALIESNLGWHVEVFKDDIDLSLVRDCTRWDYYMTDEPQSFPFDAYEIECDPNLYFDD